MADEQVDGLVISSRFDESGLDASARSELAALRKFAGDVGNIDIPSPEIDLTGFRRSIEAAGGDVGKFFGTLQDLSATTSVQVLNEIVSTLANTATEFQASSAEARQFQSVITEIRALQRRISDTGVVPDLTGAIEQAQALRQATQAPVTLNVAPVVQGAQTVVEEMGAATRAVNEVRVALSGGGGGFGPPTGLREVIGILEPIPQTAQQAAAALAQFDTALGDAGQQATTLSAATRDTIAFNERLAVAAQQAATGLTAQAQAALAAARANASVQAAGGGAGLGAAAGALVQANALAAASNVARSGAVRMAQGLALASEQATILAAAEAQALTGAGRMAAGFAGAAAQARALATAEGEAAAANVAVGTGASSAHKGLNLLRGATVALATQALGTTGTVGSLAAGLLFLAEVPNPVIIAISALIFIMEKLEGPTRKAKKETEEFIAALKEADKARLPGFQQVQLKLDEISAKSVAATARIAELQRQAAAQGAGGAAIFGRAILEEIQFVKDLAAEYLKLKPIKADLEQQDKRNAEAAAQNFQQQRESARIAALAAAPQLGTDTSASVRERASEMARLNAIIRAGGGDQTTLNQARTDYNRLLDASLFKTERQIGLDQQATQQAIQRFQQLRQQAAGLGADVSVKLDVADAEDGLRRFQGTIAADLAEVNRLRVGLDQNSAAAQRLADKARDLSGLRDAITQIIEAGRTTGLQALVDSVDAVARRLAVLRSASDGTAQSQALIAASAAQAALQYAALSAAIERAGGASQADIRLLDAQAQALKALGDGTGPLVAGLAQAFTSLRSARTAAAALGDTLKNLPDDARVRLTLDTGPAIVSLREFQERTAHDVEVVAALQVDLRTAEAQLAAFQGSAARDATVGVELRANVTRAQTALKAFRDEVSQREAVIPVSADVSDAEAAVAELLRRLAQRNKEQAQIHLGNIELPKNTDAIPQGFDKAQESVSGLNDRLTEAAFASNKFFRKMLLDLEDTRTAGQRLNDEIHDITRGLDAVAGAANNIGLIGDQAASAIGSVLDLGDAIGNVAEKASAGNILGLIGSGLNAIGAIGSALGIGKSQTEIDLEHAQNENTRALREATQAFRERFQGASGIAQQQDIVAKVVNSPAAQQAIADKDLNAFRDAVEATGISLDDFREIARASGITLVQDHHLVEGGAAALAEKLRLAAEEATRFANTFEEQSRRVALRSRLSGEAQDPAAAFRREINVAAPFSEAIKQAFGTVDLSNDAAVRKAAVDLLDRFTAGQISAADLGLSKEDFLRFLDDAAGFIEQMAAAAEANAAAILAERDARVEAAIADASLRARLAGQNQNPTAVFDEQVRAFSALSPAILNAFAGLDLANEQAVRAAALKLFDGLQAGILTPEQLGLSQEEFKKFLEDSATFLDTFNDGLVTATKSLTNVPDTFKVDLAEFTARAIDHLPANRPNDGAALPFTPLTPVSGIPLSSVQAGPVTHTYNITIVGASKDAGTLFREIKREAEFEAASRFGSTDVRVTELV